MAQRGATEGERLNAERIARKACTELGIKYEDAVKGKFGGDEMPFKSYDSTVFWYSTWHSGGFAQQQQRQAEVDEMMKAMQDLIKKKMRMQMDYTDKFGEKWSGVEVSNLSKERRRKLFGQDPLL